MGPLRRNVVFVATLVCAAILPCVDSFNECSSSPCVNGATCLDGPYGYYTCECTHGYHGDHCEEPLSDDLDDLCYFSISDPVTMATSPGFPMVSSHNVVCYYIIRIHGAKHIRITFNALNTEWNKDTIELGAGNNASKETSTHLRMGQYADNLPEPITFNTSSMFMIYVTDHNIISQGFNVTITADFDDCTPSPCHNEGVCVDEFQGFHCMCSPATTGMMCETDVISISSVAPLLTNTDVTISSSMQSLNLTFDLKLTTSPHSANPHLTIQSTSITPSWTVNVFLSQDDQGNAGRIGAIDVPLNRGQSDFSLENHVTFRNVAIMNMRIPAEIKCSDFGYFCAIFNPNNDDAVLSSSASSTSPEYVIRGDPDSSAFVGCSRVTCQEDPPCEDCKDGCIDAGKCHHKQELSDDTTDDPDEVGLNESSTWDHSHINIILLVVIGFVCTALVIIVVLVLVKGRDKVKLLFIHSPASQPAAPVMRWMPPPSTNTHLEGERDPTVQGTSTESYFGIVNEGASNPIEASPAPPYTEVPDEKKQ